MKLIEAIDDISELAEDQIFYTVGTQKITGDTEIELYRIEDIVENKVVPEGCAYFLEVVYAKEVIETLMAWRKGKQPSSDEKLKAVQYYVEHDAYLPEDNDEKANSEKKR